jgi:hypothetical protein
MDDQTKETRPYQADSCRTHILAAAEWFKKNPQPAIEKGIKGALLGVMNGLFYSDGDKEKGDAKRHVVVGWLFGDPAKPLKPMSTKELSEVQWQALARWIEVAPIQTPDGKHKWLPSQYFMTESLFVLNAALRKYRDDEENMMKQLLPGEESNG